MPFDPAVILSGLNDLGANRRIVVAFSGGMDSVVLLHGLIEALSEADSDLLSHVSAIHVNHQLSPSADAWQKFCEDFCQQRNIALQSRCIQLNPAAAGNLEEQARDARYGVFSSLLEEGDSLLLAHHLDDQIETYLQRMLRGSGMRGLAAMPRCRTLDRARILRPLLSIPRSKLAEYARLRDLHWVEDESNSDTGFDRNYLRHQLFPVLEHRWPGYREQLRQTITLNQDAESLMAEVAGADRAAVESDTGVLSVSAMQSLSAARRRNLLVHWLASGAMPQTSNALVQRINDLLEDYAPEHGSKVKSPRIEHGDHQIYLHRGCLFLIKVPGGIDTDASYPWPQAAKELALPANGRVRLRDVKLKAVLAGRRVEVGYRRGGTKLRIARRGSKSLKNLLSEQGMLPWLRARQPLIFIDGDLACVPGVALAEKFEAVLSSSQAFDWVPPALAVFDKKTATNQVSD